MYYSLSDVLRFVKSHGCQCWIEGNTVAIRFLVSDTNTGKSWYETEYARTMTGARNILGY